MNIYVRELTAQLKTFILWTISIIVVFLLFMSGMFDVLMASRDTVEKAIAGFPSVFLLVFGLKPDEFFTFGGFFGFIFSYIALVGAIMAVSVSVSIFSREKRSKCVDFLLTKPVSRETIFFWKLLASLTILIVANILFVLVSVAAFSGSGTQGTDPGRLVWASCGLFFTQIIFMTIGLVFAVFVKKVRSVSGIATAVGIGGFILSALYELLDSESIRYIAPLKYFDTAHVIKTGGYEINYVITAVIVVLICGGLAFFRFTQSDTPA